MVGFIFLIACLNLSTPYCIDNKHLIFSSPEHKVLKVSYCDQSLFVVRPYIRQQLLKKPISFETTWPNSIKLHTKNTTMGHN